MYRCTDCRHEIKINKATDNYLKQNDKKARCTYCGSYNTYKIGEPIQKRKTSLNDSATYKQIEYIKKLGGTPTKDMTKAEAGEMITRLKKGNSYA